MIKAVNPKLDKLLEIIAKDGLENYSIGVSDPNKKGEGFIGDLMFLTMSQQQRGTVLHLAIKQAFEDDKTRSAHPIRSYFLNETYFYNKLWPSFNDFQKKVLQVKVFDNIPKCYIASDEEKCEVIILEDLKNRGFQLVDKRSPLDREHLEFVFKQYGKFHATSFAYKQINPKEYSDVAAGAKNLFYMISQRKNFRDYLALIFKDCMKSLDARIDKEAINKYKKYVENGADIFEQASKYDGDFSVVLHGDCWSNNMLFKYEEHGKPMDLMLIDFQFVYQGSPVSDLSYFLYTSGSKESFDRYEDYLKLYHDSLTETLKQVRCDASVYPFRELKREWKQFCKFGFVGGLLIWRSKLILESDAKNISEVGDGDILSGSTLDEEAYRKIARELILHMHNNDFL